MLTGYFNSRLLLKYASRDEVELLGLDTNGVVGLRDAVASWEETTPLYGFMRYRSRSIVLKYLPEACGSLARGELGTVATPGGVHSFVSTQSASSVLIQCPQ